MSSAVKPPGNYNDFGSLQALARDSKTGSTASLRETARQFESLFTRMVLKSVRDASFGDPLFGDDAMKSYQEMYDDQLSVQLTAGKGLGLAEMLVRQLSRGADAPASATGAGAAGTAGISATTTAEQLAGAAIPPTGPGVARLRRASPYAASNEVSGTSPIAGPTAPTGVVDAGWVDRAVAAALGDTPLADVATAGLRVGEPEILSPEAAHAAFVRELWPSAVTAGTQLGVDPRTLIAHAALETGWGQSMPGSPSGPCSHNLFGIKAAPGWTGAAVAARTVEFDGGLPSVRTERFRAYASAADCFQDYVALLQGNTRYARALGTGGDVAAFGAALQQGGYATDPHYAAKLAAVANSLKQMPTPPLTTSQGGT